MRQYIFHGMVNLVAGFVRLPQPIHVHALFTRRKIQAVFLRQFLARLFIAVAVVAVRDRFSPVIDAVIYQMAMRMLPVGMPDKNILRVAHVHFLHVLAGDLRHRPVGYFFAGRKTQRRMAYTIFNSGIQSGLIPEAGNNGLLRLGIDSATVDQAGFAFALIQVVHASGERRSLNDFSDHSVQSLKFG